MMRSKDIIVNPYNPKWPEMFDDEASLIKHALGNHCLAIHHVGSTSVPGLAAKPQIDIIAVVDNPDQAITQLTQIGYTFRGELNIPFRLYFNNNLNENRHAQVNLHVYEKDHPEIALNLLFRNYLRSYPNVRDEYGALKEKLLQDPSSFQKQEGRMFTGYNLGKDAFIRRVLKDAGFDQIRFLKCTHDLEWDSYHKIKKKHIFAPIDVVYEKNHPSVFDPHHEHFILCKGGDVVAIAHIEFLNSDDVALRSLAVDSPYQKQGLGKKMMDLLEKWLKQQGQKMIKMHARPSAEGFYRKLGYNTILFDDTSIQKDCIDLGKVLIYTSFR